jgi:hypothetical protein
MKASDATDELLDNAIAADVVNAIAAHIRFL